MTYLSHTDKIYTNILSFTLICAFLLPHTMLPFLLVNPIMCIVLKLRSKTGWNYSFRLWPIIPILISLLVGFVGGVGVKAYQSAVTIVLYMFCFPVINGTKIKNWVLYFILGYIVLSQFAVYFSVPFVSQMIDIIYPIGEDDIDSMMWRRDHITMATINDYRMGGIYHNSNQCARYITMLIALFICNNYNRQIKENIWFLVVAFASVVLCGSRTGFAVGVLLLFLYLSRTGALSSFQKTLVVLFFIIGFIWIVINGADSGIRGTDFASGMDNSLGAKFKTFRYYLSTEDSIFRLLFGYLDTSLYSGMASNQVMGSFDSEYGSYIYKFGFFGFIALIVFYYALYKRTTKDFRFCFVIILWMVSSTLLSSYRAAFIWMIVLSYAYSLSFSGEDYKVD